MDFFGILFDMKNGSKMPYSKNYFDALFAAKLEELGVKTITGTLPLTFTTSETALRSWTIYGADIEHIETASGKSITFHTDEDKLRDWIIYGNAEGVGERTKNILDISSFQDVDQNNVVMTLNDDNATITVYTTDTPTAQAQGLCNFEVSETGNYLLSGIPTDAPNIAVNSYIWDRDVSGRAKAWDKTTDMDTCNKNSQSAEVYLEQGVRYQLRVRVQASYGKHEEPVIVSPMVRKSNTTADFVPYGYQIPITVSQTGQTDKNYDIYIGSTPLTAGQSVSKTSTGVDIATAAGNNTITTTLYNQPDMSITYNEFTGVGILTANLFMIALQLKAGGQTLNVFNTLMNKPLRAGETLTSEQTGQTINTVAGVENKLSPAPKVASYGGSFNMTIKYKE